VIDDEEPTGDATYLAGGTANVGSVLRTGDIVTKPAGPAAPSIQHYLAHLSAAGCDFVPTPQGVEGDRQHLGFIDGTVVGDGDERPKWVADDTTLVAVARLQLRLHECSKGYIPTGDALFEVPYLPEIGRGELVCHNDLGISNVVFSDTATPLPVGFIDFDYAAPVDPLFDIAVAMRHWVPMWNPADLADVYADVDQLERFALWSDVFGLDATRRQRLLEIVCAYVEVARDVVIARAAASQPGFRALIDGGYESASRRTSAWLEQW
jgi:hypothetical protein